MLPRRDLPRRLQEGGAERAFLEKLDLFRQNPGLLEQYLIESGASPEVLDSFLSRLCRSEGLSAVADAKDAVESVLDSSPVGEKSGGVSEKSPGPSDERWAVVEELKQQVLDLTREVSALQRQRQMQGEVSQVAASLEGRGLRASSEDLRRLEEEVARLNCAEKTLGHRISAVEARVTEAERVLWAERIDRKSNRFDGIIAHLTRECGGNVHKKGVVNVTASSCYGDSFKPENAVDLGSDEPFASKDSPNSWLCYDFKERRVAPKSYTIRSWGAVAGYNHIKSWVLEVSNDGSEGSWQVVDLRENNNDLNGGFSTGIFALTTPQSGMFRFVRLRLTGKTHRGDDMLEICALELFGALSLA